MSSSSHEYASGYDPSIPFTEQALGIIKEENRTLVQLHTSDPTAFIELCRTEGYDAESVLHKLIIQSGLEFTE